MLPNKAVAGAGGTSVSGALVAIGLWAFGIAPPQEIVIAMTTVAAAGVAFVSVYLTKMEQPPV